MLFGWAVVVIALAYIGALFAVAGWAEKHGATYLARHRPTIYALALGVYCTSWTFYGSVGMATTRGFDFLAIYLGPILLFAVTPGLLRRVVALSKTQKITSLADFLAARYGKNQRVAVVATIIIVVGVLPYIALQLKAISTSITALLGGEGTIAYVTAPLVGDLPLLVALSLALFSILFGTRTLHQSERQYGLMFAIAVESVVKLAAFLVVGGYIVFVLYDGPGDLLEAAAITPGALAPFSRDIDGGQWITLTGLSFVAALLLPRMFHMAVIESDTTDDVRRATWLFPLYLVAINLFVPFIAIAGLTAFAGQTFDADMLVLALPLSGGASAVSIIAFIGGLSSATAMVIIANVAISVMIANEIVTPLLLFRRQKSQVGEADMGRTVLLARRIGILVVLMLAYAYQKFAVSDQHLAAIGLLSFTAIVQLAPAFFGGLIWPGASAAGALCGLIAGSLMWAYTLLLPSFAASGLISSTFLTLGPWDIGWLKPQGLLHVGLDPLTHGVFWSLLVNLIGYVAGSLFFQPKDIEASQAKTFIAPPNSSPSTRLRIWRTAITVRDLEETVSRYLGAARTQASLQGFAQAHRVDLQPGMEADIELLRHCEYLLASAIGAASARLVLALLLRRRNVSAKAALRLLDDASAALQYNRDLLHTALDEVNQGIAVFDRDLRLITWNRRFDALLELPTNLISIGTSVQDIITYLANRGEFGAGSADELVATRLAAFLATGKTQRRPFLALGLILEIRTARLPGGGYVSTFSDVTQQVQAAENLERVNASLEIRVRERTDQLMRLNDELARARATADDANLGKTKFLAAAGHDILQPLNAARLYISALLERDASSEHNRLVSNVDQSLEAVEEIIGALLDISRLDTGALKTEITSFPLGELMRQIDIEFVPTARDRGLDLVVLSTELWVTSDRRLLRRLLQNLVSNALKYTREGRVLVGCRRRGAHLDVQVWDSGLGIPEHKQEVIFREFERLDQGARMARGLGLGLSIVERIGKVLGHPIMLRSWPGKGSMFSVSLPRTVARAVPASARADPTSANAFAGIEVACIDNDVTILDGMSVLLSGWGCTVVTGQTSGEVMESYAAKKAEPAIVLVDYHLDRASGIDAIADLRRHFGARLPAALVTADRSPTLRAEAASSSIAIINKPVRPGALRALVAQLHAQRTAAE